MKQTLGCAKEEKEMDDFKRFCMFMRQRVHPFAPTLEPQAPSPYHTCNASQLREHVLHPATLGPSASPQPPPAFVDPDGAASYQIKMIVAHEVRASGVRYCIRWRDYGPAHDTWDSEPSLLQQHGGRVAVALYRARCAAVDQHGRDSKRRAKHGRNAQLPTLSPATAWCVATSLRDYELAQAAAP